MPRVPQGWGRPRPTSRGPGVSLPDTSTTTPSSRWEGRRSSPCRGCTRCEWAPGVAAVASLTPVAASQSRRVTSVCSPGHVSARSRPGTPAGKRAGPELRLCGDPGRGPSAPAPRPGADRSIPPTTCLTPGPSPTSSKGSRASLGTRAPSPASLKLPRPLGVHCHAPSSSGRCQLAVVQLTDAPEPLGSRLGVNPGPHLGSHSAFFVLLTRAGARGPCPHRTGTVGTGKPPV